MIVYFKFEVRNMKGLMIAIIGSTSTEKELGFRILDTSTWRIADYKADEIYSGLSTGSLSISNLETKAFGRLQGSNGSLSRYPHIGVDAKPIYNGNVLTIIGELGDVGYIVTGFDGSIKRVIKTQVIAYCKKFGVSNGKVITRNGESYISPIKGNYIRYPLDTLAKPKSEVKEAEDAESTQTTQDPTPKEVKTPTSTGYTADTQDDTDSSLADSREKYLLAVLALLGDNVLDILTPNCYRLIMANLRYSESIPAGIVNEALVQLRSLNKTLKNKLFGPGKSYKYRAIMQQEALENEVIRDQNDYSKLYKAVWGRAGLVLLINIAKDINNSTSKKFGAYLRSNETRPGSLSETSIRIVDLCRSMVSDTAKIDDIADFAQSTYRLDLSNCANEIIDYINKPKALEASSSSTENNSKASDQTDKLEIFKSLQKETGNSVHSREIDIATSIANRGYKYDTCSRKQKYTIDKAIELLLAAKSNKNGSAAEPQKGNGENKVYPLSEREDIQKKVSYLLSLGTTAEIAKVLKADKNAIKICYTVRKTQKASERQIAHIEAAFQVLSSSKEEDKA